jgi:hypothetical protein
VDPSFTSGLIEAHAQTEIAAGERVVWSVLAGIDAWPTWNPAIRGSTLRDELEVGRSFRYATAFGSLRCKLREVDAPRSLAWSGRLLTITERQAWSIEPVAGGCRVRIQASLSGVGAWLFKARLEERLTADLGAVVQLLRLEAESRVAEEFEQPTMETATDE